MILKILSCIGLVMTILPAFLVFNKSMSIELYKNVIMVGTLLWFTTAPFWIFRKKKKL